MDTKLNGPSYMSDHSDEDYIDDYANQSEASNYNDYKDNLGYINDDNEGNKPDATVQAYTSNNDDSTNKTTDMLNQFNQYLKDEQSKLDQNNMSKMGQ